MPPTLFAHPFSSYSQKVLIALYENETPFTYRMLGPDDPDAMTELEARWPMRRFPILVDDGHAIIEASIIIEHLMLYHPGQVPMLPADPAAALAERTMDRFFDNYVMTPMAKIVLDRNRDEADRDPTGVAEARATLETSYRWLEDAMSDRTWATGDIYGIADCAASPALFYADWVHEIGPAFPNVRAYRARLLARPSFARCVEEARPHRLLFPLGAPNRD